MSIDWNAVIWFILIAAVVIVTIWFLAWAFIASKVMKQMNDTRQEFFGGKPISSTPRRHTRRL